MAKSKKPFYFTGTINGLTYYFYRDRPCVRKKSNLTQERFRQDPEFEPSRKRASHFGSASKASKTFRAAISPFDAAFADTSLHSRLTAAIAAAIKENPQACEDGKVNFREMSDKLSKLQLRSDVLFEDTATLYYAMKVEPKKKLIQLEAATNGEYVFRNAPCSTHFRLLLILATLSGNKTPRPLDPREDLAKQATWASEWQSTEEAIRITQTIEIPKFMQNGEPIAILLAIQPGGKDGSGIYSLETGRAMRLLDII